MRVLDQAARLMKEAHSFAAAMERLDPFLRDRALDLAYARDDEGNVCGFVVYDAAAPYLASASAFGVLADGSVHGPAFRDAAYVRGDFEDVVIEAEALGLHVD